MPNQYPALSKNDEGLLADIFARLTERIKADPYGDDGVYATAIRQLPIGLRAMASTHHLDISLTMDDIGWHFLNFGEPHFVKETELGLRELGLQSMADWFLEAYEIVNPLRAEIAAGVGYYKCLRNHGQMDRIDELTRKANESVPGAANNSPIYDSWIKYARQRPEDVFGS